MDAEFRCLVFADSISEKQVQVARAVGYRAMTYPGESYPVLIEAPGEVAQGLVLLEVNAEALERMAYYEGQSYALHQLEVVTQEGATIRAHYNVAADETLEFVDPWCYQTWLKNDRQALLDTTRQYMEHCWGKLSLAESDKVWQELRSLHLGLK